MWSPIAFVDKMLCQGVALHCVLSCYTLCVSVMLVILMAPPSRFWTHITSSHFSYQRKSSYANVSKSDIVAHLYCPSLKD